MNFGKHASLCFYNAAPGGDLKLKLLDFPPQRVLVNLQHEVQLDPHILNDFGTRIRVTGQMPLQSIVPMCDQLLGTLGVAALMPDGQQSVKNSVRWLCHGNALQSLGLAPNAVSTGENQRQPNYS